jgi:hypothetical protein
LDFSRPKKAKKPGILFALPKSVSGEHCLFCSEEAQSTIDFLCKGWIPKNKSFYVVLIISYHYISCSFFTEFAVNFYQRGRVSGQEFG